MRQIWQRMNEKNVRKCNEFIYESPSQVLSYRDHTVLAHLGSMGKLIKDKTKTRIIEKRKRTD